MSTIMENMFTTPLISSSLTDIDLSDENRFFSAYRNGNESKRIPGGLVNAMIKIFLGDQIGLGVTDKGEIYTEVKGDARDEVVSVLYDLKANKLKACKFNRDNSAVREPVVKDGNCPAYLIIPYLMKQRIQDINQELEKSWNEVNNSAADSNYRFLSYNEGVGIIIDSSVCGAADEFNINIGEIEHLDLAPSEVYDYTPELLKGKCGSFVLANALTKPDNIDPFTEGENKSYQEEMRGLKNEVWPLVEEYYEGLSEEDKALVPDENRLGIYIPTKRFKDIVHIIADGIKNGDMDSQNVLLKGPPGTGKSTMAVAIAYVFSMPYRFTQSYKTADASEYIGTTIADNGVLKTNINTQFAKTVMNGGVHMDDDNSATCSHTSLKR